MPKLLLADDSPTTQKVVQLTFADEGVDVIVADDGDSAMELYDHHHPDIVLADINIPGLNGYEVCEAIRKRSSNGKTPVILLAGSFEPFDVEQAHRVGANDYLTKPFSSIRRLVATVTAMLDTAARTDEAVEETIEPNSIPPQSQQQSTATVQNQPGPVMGVGEPDMLSATDIEALYSQSVAQTIEMPHTIAERLAGQTDSPTSETSSGHQTSSFNDVAFDDELIETTFRFPETDDESQEHPENSNDIVQEVAAGNSGPADGESSPTIPSQIPVPVGDLPDEERTVPQSEVPTLGFERVSENINNDQPEPTSQQSEEFMADPPSGDLQIDQSGFETYFEPAPEHAEPQANFESLEQQLPAESHEQQPESVAVPEIGYFEPPEIETEQDESSDSQVETAPAGDQSFQVSETTIPSPWESVAGPASPTFSMDELNLLELPGNITDRQEAVSQVPVSGSSEIAEQVNQLTPEIVDEIARATASQISEELVREIASRIVPKVIEEVMARKGSDGSEH